MRVFSLPMNVKGKGGVMVCSGVKWLALTMGVLVPASALAQESSADTLRSYTLGEVVVQNAARTAPLIEGIRLRAADWVETDAPTVAEAVRLAPSTHVVTNSRGETVLSLRGASDRQSTVYFDGALLTLPWDQRLDLGLLPAATVGSATVFSGAAPVRFGAGGSGGVVNLVSRDLGSDGRVLEIEAAGEQPRGGRLSGTWLERRGVWSSVVSVQTTQTDGVALPNETPLAFSQPDDAVRTNTDRALTSAFGRVSVAVSPAARLGVAVLHLDAEQGVAPEGHLDPAVDRVRFWRYPHWRYTLGILSGEARSRLGTVRGAVWGGRFGQTIERFTDVSYAALDEQQEDADGLVGARLVLEHELTRGALRLALNGRHALHEEQEASPNDEPTALARRYQQSIGSVGVEGDWQASSRLAVTGGVGMNALLSHEAGAFASPDPLTALALTSGATLDIADGLVARLSMGRRTRFPSMRERYDDALGRFAPNPDLRPEAAWLLDVGLHGSTAAWQGSATVFARRVTETIEVAVRPDGLRERVNLGGSRAFGVEVAGAARLSAALRVDGHLTLLHVRGFTDEETGLRLTETPNALGRVAVSRRPARGLLATAEALVTGVAYSAVTDGLTRLDPSFRLNLRAGYRLLLPQRGVAGEVFGRIDNVFDTVYFPQIGLPAPGRTVRIGLRLALG
ncbi:MAG: TonB-dependent receptor [Rhodothermaceae bacterium]|nr:TonB-dependent receptor [Rhodothermaceae bacterium]